MFNPIVFWPSLFPSALITSFAARLVACLSSVLFLPHFLSFSPHTSSPSPGETLVSPRTFHQRSQSPLECRLPIATVNCQRIGEELRDSASHPCLPSSCVLTRPEARLQIHIRSQQMWVSGAASASSSSSSPFFLHLLTGRQALFLSAAQETCEIHFQAGLHLIREKHHLQCARQPHKKELNYRAVLVRRMFKATEMLKRNRLSRMNQCRLSFRQKWLIVQSVGSSAHLWESHILQSAACAAGRFEILSRQNNVQLNELFCCTSTICCRFYCKYAFLTT